MTCRRLGATLVIAKLDRLARNVAFVSNLMESGVEFIAVDFPTANRLTIHILAAVAEHEREVISARTKAALAAAKARGTKLGTPNLTDEARAKGREVARKVLEGRAAARAADLAAIVAEIRAGGRTSLRAIAAELDARGIPAPRGGKWTAPAVMRLTAAELGSFADSPWKRLHAVSEALADFPAGGGGLKKPAMAFLGSGAAQRGACLKADQESRAPARPRTAPPYRQSGRHQCARRCERRGGARMAQIYILTVVEPALVLSYHEERSPLSWAPR